MSNSSIPQSLTSEQAESLTQVLLLARKHLRDAASPSKIYAPSYASTSMKIKEVLEALGVEVS